MLHTAFAVHTGSRIMIESNNAQVIVDQIAQALGEEKKGPLYQIEQIVCLYGAEQALTWLAETQAIEAGGGMLTYDGQRQRTLGGVFFRMVRDRLVESGQQDNLHTIFGSRKTTDLEPSQRQASWSERDALIAEAGTQIGKANSVKVTITGKPGKVVERQNFTLMMLKDAGTLPTIPRGIPAPARVPQTTYIVYVATKQWNKVKDALAQNDNSLIIDGAQFYDPEYGAIAVLATNVKVQSKQQPDQKEQAASAPSPSPSA